MATILEQTIAKMQASEHRLTTCGECGQYRTMEKVSLHTVDLIRCKVEGDWTDSERDDLAHAVGYCGRRCHAAFLSRDGIFKPTDRFSVCAGCNRPFDLAQRDEYNAPIRGRFCSDGCYRGYEVRLALGRRHIVVMRSKGDWMIGGGIQFANGTLRGVEIIAEILDVAPLLVFEVLHTDRMFDRWGRIQNYGGQIFTCVRMNAGAGTMGHPLWTDDHVATGPNGKRWKTHE